MATPSAMQELVNEKLAAFERLQPEFEACFHFVQLVHGQQRFNKFPLVNAVRYLHSLWVCECKDRLLSIYRNIERYEGRYCLELLLRWQEGETADVVDFLNRKLDMLPFQVLTRRIPEAMRSHKTKALARGLMTGPAACLIRARILLQA